MMLQKFYQRHKEGLNRMDQFLLGNPVLERGLVLAPIVVTCTTVKNALTLSAAFAVITILTILTTRFFSARLPYTIRVILNASLASLIFVPISLLVRSWQPDVIYSLGIYFPLLTTNSLIVQKSESRYHNEKFPVMLVQLLTASLGFAFTAFLIASAREIFGKGTFMGQPLSAIRFTAPALLLPFSGFILLGLLAALLQKIRIYLEKPSGAKKKKEEPHA